MPVVRRRSARIAAQSERIRIQAIRDAHSVVECDHSWRGLREARGRHPDYDGQELIEFDVLRVGNHSFDVCARCLMMVVWFVDPGSGLRQYPPMQLTLPSGVGIFGVQLGIGGLLGECRDRQYSTAVIECGCWPDISVPSGMHPNGTHEDGEDHEPAGVWAVDFVD